MPWHLHLYCVAFPFGNDLLSRNALVPPSVVHTMPVMNQFCANISTTVKNCLANKKYIIYKLLGN